MNVEGTQFSPNHVPAIVPDTFHSKDEEIGLDRACECYIDHLHS